MLALRRARNFGADFDHDGLCNNFVVRVRQKEHNKLRWSHQNFGGPQDFRLKSAKRPD